MNPSRLLMLGLVLLLSGSVFGAERGGYDFVEDNIPGNGPYAVAGNVEKGVENYAYAGEINDGTESPEQQSVKKEDWLNLVSHALTLLLFGVLFCVIGSVVKGSLKKILWVMLIALCIMVIGYMLGWDIDSIFGISAKKNSLEAQFADANPKKIGEAFCDGAENIYACMKEQMDGCVGCVASTMEQNESS
eukprot:199466_1